MITYKQAYMAKQAGLFGNTMVGRGITNLFGPRTFVSDALGASAMDMIDHEAKQLYSQPAVYTPPPKPQPKPAPPVAETNTPTYTSTGKRQGYRTPDGQWHDIGATTTAQPAARQQPAATTTNWKFVPKGHENQRQVAQTNQRRSTPRRG